MRTEKVSLWIADLIPLLATNSFSWRRMEATLTSPCSPTSILLLACARDDTVLQQIAEAHKQNLESMAAYNDTLKYKVGKHKKDLAGVEVIQGGQCTAGYRKAI